MISRITAVIALIAVPSMGQAPRTPDASPQDATAQIVEQLNRQPAGGVTLKDFCLPEPFLGRVADRIIRIDYQRRFRAVSAAAASSGGALDTAASTPGPGQTTTSAPATPAPKRGAPVAVFSGAMLITLIAIIRVVRRRREKA